MRILALVLLMVAAASAQDKAIWLVLYETQEKCYECQLRYLMGCGVEDPECNVPLKSVLRAKEFRTKSEAVAFLGGQLGEEKNVIVNSVRLIRGEPLAVTVKRETKEVPQPLAVQTTIRYEVK